MENGGNRLAWRASVLAKHFSQIPPSPQNALAGVPCLQYGSPEENSGKPAFDITVMRKLMDGHSVEVRDQCFELMRKNELFHLKTGGSTTFLGVDYGALLHTQREITMERLMYMRDSGVFKGLLTVNTMEQYLTTSAVFECMSLFDHSLSIKAGVHFHLW